MDRLETENIPWYEEWFNREEYELVYQDRNETDAAQLIDVIEAVVRPTPETSILDVACGRGRHARLLARRGYQITGLDLAERAVETARRRAAEEELEITFLQQDMRELSIHGGFDGAVNLFTSFGYFDSDEDHKRVICNIARALKSGGWFVQDFLNVPHVRKTLVPQDQRTENGLQIEQERWIANGRLNKQITIERNDDSRTFMESVRLLTLEDFRQLYAAAGLELVDIRGDYDGSSYSNESPRLIMFSRKRKQV